MENTIQILFLIWIFRSFKKGASDNTISYFNQSFQFSGAASNLFWSEIWGDLVKISRREQRENKWSFFLKFWTVKSKGQIFFLVFRGQTEHFFFQTCSWSMLSESQFLKEYMQFWRFWWWKNFFFNTYSLQKN